MNSICIILTTDLIQHISLLNCKTTYLHSKHIFLTYVKKQNLRSHCQKMFRKHQFWPKLQSMSTCRALVVPQFKIIGSENGIPTNKMRHLAIFYLYFDKCVTERYLKKFCFASCLSTVDICIGTKKVLAFKYVIER